MKYLNQNKFLYTWNVEINLIHNRHKKNKQLFLQHTTNNKQRNIIACNKVSEYIVDWGKYTSYCGVNC